MPLSPAAQKQVDEWLRYAHSDLALARADVPEVLPELLCFHAQQAAEKALKALFIGLGLPFPLIHHLGRLLDLLEDRGETIPAEVRAADTLTLYAVVTRYPLPPGAPVTQDELNEAIAAAEAVLQWSHHRLGLSAS